MSGRVSVSVCMFELCAHAYVRMCSVNDTIDIRGGNSPRGKIAGKKEERKQRNRGDYVCWLLLNKHQYAEINERERERERGRERDRDRERDGKETE